MVHHRHLRRAAGGVIVVGGLALTTIVPASADGPIDSTALRNAVTVSGILAHEQALQAIANSNGGTRAAGTPGFLKSGEYVEGLLGAAGYRVTRQNFSYEQFVLNSSAMQQIAPNPATYVEDTDFAAMSYSGNGDATAAVQAVDINLVGDRASTSGCEAADFGGFTPGNIALIQRGSCFFRVKVDNAAAAGASAVIVFNQGNIDPNDDRFGLFFGTLDPPVAAIPAVSTTFVLGEALANTSGLQMRLEVSAAVRTTNTFSVLADTPGGRADRMVVVGAHLDSVHDGPGINDNGSGTSAILETAVQMANLGITPTNRVRFAFWGGEEDGLIGSDYYVSQLNARALKQH